MVQEELDEDPNPNPEDSTRCHGLCVASRGSFVIQGASIAATVGQLQ